MTSLGRMPPDQREAPDQAVPVLVRPALAAGEHEVLRAAAADAVHGVSGGQGTTCSRSVGKLRYLTISSADTWLSVITRVALAAPRFSIHFTGPVRAAST